ncbi:MAG: hypothetical protein EB101_03190 [Chitinophagia bacterium]|nr:hypothetical protein [Chitinophagia bacterium]
MKQNVNKIEAVEYAMRKLAGELHDNIAPTLLLIRIQLEQLQQDNNLTALEDCKKSIDQVLNETAQLAGQLGATSLAKKGLIEATSDLLNSIKLYKKLYTTLEVDTIPLSIEKEKELSIFRIIQESVQNVVKHAQATVLSITISTKGDSIDIQITDNGKGFHADRIEVGSGLSNMQERAAALAGRLLLKTKPAAGTTVHLQIPKS